MQTFTPTETRIKMIEQGLDPEYTRLFLEEAIDSMEVNLELTRGIMSPTQIFKKEMAILNGKIVLSIVRNACLSLASTALFL